MSSELKFRKLWAQGVGVEEDVDESSRSPPIQAEHDRRTVRGMRLGYVLNHTVV